MVEWGILATIVIILIFYLGGNVIILLWVLLAQLGKQAELIQDHIVTQEDYLAHLERDAEEGSR